MLGLRCRLIDNGTMRSQLLSLERRIGASDRESIGHPQHQSAHDDVACVAAGALVEASLDKFKPLIGIYAQSFVIPMAESPAGITGRS